LGSFNRTNNLRPTAICASFATQIASACS
jgi:hypothetical protein